MTEINLLPWREERREQERKNFLTMLMSSFIIALGIVFVATEYASSLVDSQLHRNQRLQTEINQLDNQLIEIKRLTTVRDGLISRMRIVHTLLEGRVLTIHLFDELARVLPDGVYFTEIKRVEDKVTLHGFADSNSSISLLMRSIQSNSWIHNPLLTQIKKSGDNSVVENNEFDLSFIIMPKSSGYKLKNIKNNNIKIDSVKKP